MVHLSYYSNPALESPEMDLTLTLIHSWRRKRPNLALNSLSHVRARQNGWLLLLVVCFPPLWQAQNSTKTPSIGRSNFPKQSVSSSDKSLNLAQKLPSQVQNLSQISNFKRRPLQVQVQVQNLSTIHTPSELIGLGHKWPVFTRNSMSCASKWLIVVCLCLQWDGMGWDVQPGCILGPYNKRPTLHLFFVFYSYNPLFPLFFLTTKTRREGVKKEKRDTEREKEGSVSWGES